MRKHKTYSGEFVAVAGLLRTRCGLQRGADLMLRDLRNNGTFALPVDLSYEMRTPITLDIAGSVQPTDLRLINVSDVIIHLNPPLFSSSLASFARKTLDSACIVGYWAWELNRLPEAWNAAAELCDEIWAPSNFVANTIRDSIPEFRGLVRTVPHPVDCDPMPALKRANRLSIRRQYGISDSDFVAGTSFSFSSNYTRKNAVGSIDAFRKAFSEHDNVRMIVRCNDANHNPPQLREHLKSYVGTDDRITIMETERVKFPILDFYGCLDVYVSLHRSEGYGLTLAEASQTGLPVIATGWEIAEDIAARSDIHLVDYRLVVPLDAQGSYPYIPGGMWAEPNLDHAAKLLQQVRRMVMSTWSS